MSRNIRQAIAHFVVSAASAALAIVINLLTESTTWWLIALTGLLVVFNALVAAYFQRATEEAAQGTAPANLVGGDISGINLQGLSVGGNVTLSSAPPAPNPPAAGPGSGPTPSP
ncbi:hypothetical protein [Streptomyces jumonjinensis]|uniref:hypothetical protein n=1 Tax=Streptomyces jumonjinensis TaxID=1945 RepID=UPI00379A6F25